MSIKKVNIRLLGIHKYEHILHAMYKYIYKNKNNNTNEIWFLEHYPVFTLGNLDKKKNVIYQKYQSLKLIEEVI
ncbi:MAG: lipoyl(octanoyl) transferase LipB [Wigglesworthia glossinidia]|nr:lipoyl(octanoyl) transferase LipB [Wigglesworthia glossinidia]